MKTRVWRSFWDWAIFAGSLIPALLWGVAFANFVRGVPIDDQMQLCGRFLESAQSLCPAGRAGDSGGFYAARRGLPEPENRR